mgnify:CR=1 FL=1
MEEIDEKIDRAVFELFDKSYEILNIVDSNCSPKST